MPVVSSILIEGLAFEIQTPEFKELSDVPQAQGGTGRGPSPHDYLEIALSACTAITLQMYAKRKDLPLEYADVKIKIVQEGAENLMQRQIHLIGNLSEEQRQALLAIAEKCPIHRFLTRGSKITSELISG